MNICNFQNQVQKNTQVLKTINLTSHSLKSKPLKSFPKNSMNNNNIQSAFILKNNLSSINKINHLHNQIDQQYDTMSINSYHSRINKKAQNSYQQTMFKQHAKPMIEKTFGKLNYYPINQIQIIIHQANKNIQNRQNNQSIGKLRQSKSPIKKKKLTIITKIN